VADGAWGVSSTLDRTITAAAGAPSSPVNLPVAADQRDGAKTVKDDEYLMAAAEGGPVPFSVRDYALSAGLTVFACLVANLVADAYGEVAAALILVLGIVVTGAVGGLVCALVASAASFLVFNFLIAEPVLTLRLANGRDVTPLVVFSLVGILSGVLAGRLRDQTAAARASNMRLGQLLAFSRALQSAASAEDVAATLSNVAERTLGVRAELRSAGGGDRPGNPPEPRPEASGGAADATRLTLEGTSGGLGEIVLDGDAASKLGKSLTEALARLVTLALERAALAERVAEREADFKAEGLRTALLSSVSHDFRTPLTTISASASSLLDYGDRLDRETSAMLLKGIVDECERLNRYTANLLEMSRLEAGQGMVGAQALGVAEMIAVAVQRIRSRSGERVIRVDAAQDGALVNANAALFELVLVNVLENSVSYSDDGTQIVVSSDASDKTCRVRVADQGWGIPEAELGRVFGRFHRVPHSDRAARGSGLGLAIAKGFVEAMGGSIEARTPGIGDRGTEIVIELPRVTKGPEA
jgi:two-component system, OmpR family, sensor histidine kinase KdpD